MPDIVYLHVGPHKTGTTALQQSFAINQARLLRYGILYPQSGRTGAAHQDLARACRTGDKTVLQALGEEIQSAQRVLISSELIAGLVPHELTRLADVLGASNVEVIYTLRRLPALWTSHWKELIKHGQAFDFEHYLSLHMDPDARSYNLPPRPISQLNALEQVFGRDSLRLVVYDARFDPPDAYGPDFVDDVLGLGQEADAFVSDVVNHTAPDWQSEITRQFNILAQDRLNYDAKWRLRAAFLERLDSDPPAWIPDFVAAWKALPPFVLSDLSDSVVAQQKAVLAQYEDLIADPISTYTAPIERHIRSFSPNGMPEYLRTCVVAMFEELAG